MSVNGKAYDWEDITIALVNGPQVDLTDIEYSDEMPTEGQYGRGAVPRRYGQGNWKGDGKITLNREGLDALLGYCLTVGKALYKLAPFPITVVYANDDQGVHTDKIKGAKFTKAAHKAAQGDTGVKVDLDIVVLWDIERDGVSAHGG
jgi:hypothetical protein